MYYIVKETERTSEFLADKKKIKGQTWINDLSLAKPFSYRVEADYAAGELRRNNLRVVDEQQARSIQDDSEYASLEEVEYSNE
ncbi:MAG: hypothetical protein A2W93_14300 [Bacteroidetes bacterium GWF2_43_63]|nr:MAG: hypothetical protein A2W94_00870 [Bacteroidetes bacterium GWE2_42_42]OFY52512.1 MAG: hypothetical protein A2W93_14300 [Bacteroidetes bacterium GWF2_43_63]HBG71419.1 hypothetical protein [Bacteroidales bacterium]HCB60829.1 hypothetical protein [Bacteroidales bacterium]HCY23446.1 hypothetical protein [Bacteroidales bacterium]